MEQSGVLESLTKPNPTVAAARASYSYDGFDRVISETHAELSKTTSYDPFDRVTVQNVTKTGVSKKTRFAYLGASEQVAAEERLDGSTWKQVKAYGYGPDGKPLVMSSTPVTGAAKTRYYSTSTHGDSEALTDPGTGDVTAAYRYTAYGSPDVNDNAGEDTVGQKDDTSNPADPTKDALNPYRYSSKRIDAATGDYDMGFRNYSPGLNRFLTRDMYNGALSDLKLGMDPWNTNRYAFAGGNPITRIELDGHRASCVDGVGGTCGYDGSTITSYQPDQSPAAPSAEATEDAASDPEDDNPWGPDWAHDAGDASAEWIDHNQDALLHTATGALHTAGGVALTGLGVTVASGCGAFAVVTAVTVVGAAAGGACAAGGAAAATFGTLWAAHGILTMGDSLDEYESAPKKKQGGESTAAASGREVHSKFNEGLRQLNKADSRWEPGRTTGPHRPDGFFMGRPIELKPDSPSGIRAGLSQLRRYMTAFGQDRSYLYLYDKYGNISYSRMVYPK